MQGRFGDGNAIVSVKHFIGDGGTDDDHQAPAAAGLTVLTGLNGQISLGHGALMAIGAYTTALLLQDDDPLLPLVAVLLVATLSTLLVGITIIIAVGERWSRRPVEHARVGGGVSRRPELHRLGAGDQVDGGT